LPDRLKVVARTARLVSLFLWGLRQRGDVVLARLFLNIFVAMRAPEQLFVEPYFLRSLKMDDAVVVESCTHQESTANEMLVGRHLLLFVIEGRYIARFGDEEFTIEKGEGLLVKRTHSVKYQKLGYIDGDKPYESLMFFLTDDIVRDFLTLQRGRVSDKAEAHPLARISYNEPVQIFLRSVLACFNNGLSNNPAFLQNKLFELLFNLSEINPRLIAAFSGFTAYEPVDLPKVMEANFKENLTLEEFAYKAGRSLASFKRDFQKIYNTSPHQWLLSRRLEFARGLIENSGMRIADACYESGFESVAHFSRVFKQKFGMVPSVLK
jgi:AraC family transcriptional regulator, exoenzyme S synthesis regulatory protein ExsA